MESDDKFKKLFGRLYDFYESEAKRALENRVSEDKKKYLNQSKNRLNKEIKKEHKRKKRLEAKRAKAAKKPVLFEIDGDELVYGKPEDKPRELLPKIEIHTEKVSSKGIQKNAAKINSGIGGRKDIPNHISDYLFEFYKKNNPSEYNIHIYEAELSELRSLIELQTVLKSLKNLLPPLDIESSDVQKYLNNHLKPNIESLITRNPVFSPLAEEALNALKFDNLEQKAKYEKRSAEFPKFGLGFKLSLSVAIIITLLNLVSPGDSKNFLGFVFVFTIIFLLIVMEKIRENKEFFKSLEKAREASKRFLNSNLSKEIQKLEEKKKRSQIDARLKSKIIALPPFDEKSLRESDKVKADSENNRLQAEGIPVKYPKKKAHLTVSRPISEKNELVSSAKRKSTATKKSGKPESNLDASPDSRRKGKVNNEEKIDSTIFSEEKLEYKLYSNKSPHGKPIGKRKYRNEMERIEEIVENHFLVFDNRKETLYIEGEEFSVPPAPLMAFILLIKGIDGIVSYGDFISVISEKEVDLKKAGKMLHVYANTAHGYIRDLHKATNNKLKKFIKNKRKKGFILSTEEMKYFMIFKNDD